MAVTRKKKEETLQDLVKNMKEARAVVFARYSGVPVKDINQMRKKLREHEISYKVAKKTLLNLAASQAGLQPIPDEILDGPIGVGFGFKDEVMPAKLIYDFSKQAKGMELLGGLIGGKILNKQAINKLAMLPAREILLAKLLSVFQSPIYGFYGVTHGILRNLVGVIKAYEEKKTTS